MASAPDTHRSGGLNFLEQIVERDLAAGKVSSIVTRFPPEPNGYLHIGHAKAICINFGMVEDYPGRCHLRFDDTNPEKEDLEYVRSIQDDVRWLGFDWGEHLYFASDYFEDLYRMAVRLIKAGKAYVDSQTEEEIRAHRGTVTEPGVNSPFRDRSPEENLELFAGMRSGEFSDGAHVLRARIDMASPNMLLRDPVLYRIKHAHHYRTGSDWPIYPLYDFAHPLSDAIEGISHSLCSLEFEVHRPLYDWLVDALFEEPRPHQYEFARLNMDYTVTSKRKLLRLVESGVVDGWDDPRMPTLAAFRRRGVTPEAIRRFCDLIGVAKADNRVDISLLEYAIRDDLNQRTPRVMAVLDPVRVTLTNWPADHIEWMKASFWPPDSDRTETRTLPFGRTLYIDRDDFQIDPPSSFHRLKPGGEVRLRFGYVIRCEDVITGTDGQVAELLCTYDPETRSGGGSKRKVKGTIHWVEATQAVRAEVRLYDRLFSDPVPDDVPEGTDFLENLNPDSKQVRSAFLEPSLADARPGDRFQFERQGYFAVDPDSRADALVFNRTITLRDTWAKAQTEEPRAPRKERRTETAPTDASPPIPTLSAEQEAAADDLAARFGLAPDDSAILVSDPWLLEMFRGTASIVDPVAAANWTLHEVQRLRKASAEPLKLTPAALASLIELMASEAISSRIAKELLAEVSLSGEDPAALVEARGLKQIGDSAALVEAARRVIAANPEKAEAYRGGKAGLIGFFMGLVMRETGGQANPEMARGILEKELA